MWRNLTLASAGVFFCLPFTPIGFWPYLPLAASLFWEAPQIVERVRFKRQAKRELRELIDA